MADKSELRLSDVSQISAPFSDHFSDANRAVRDLAEAVEELQCELQNAHDDIAELRERITKLEQGSGKN